MNAAGILLLHKQRLHRWPQPLTPRATNIVPGFPAAAVGAPADYIGCMKTGPVMKSNKYRWFEPQHMLIGAEYFAHAWGEHEESCVAAGMAAAVQRFARCLAAAGWETNCIMQQSALLAAVLSRPASIATSPSPPQAAFMC